MITPNWPDHAAALNALQENGIISDECVTWKDVAQADVDTAIEWLLANDPE